MQSLRDSDSNKECIWLVIVDDRLEWHESYSSALQSAEWELKQAAEGDYLVQVYVCKSLKQTGDL